MKKIALLLPLMFLFSFTKNSVELTAKEREFAVNYLNATRLAVFEATRGLSQNQLQFKAAPDRWSIEDCVKHIAVSELNLRKMVDGLISQPANPEKRVDIKASDEELIQGITDRSKKVKASESFDPVNTPYKSTQEALDNFSASREKLVDYIRVSRDDLRNHVTDLPFGTYDSYQLVLLVGAHSSRHTHQIAEVKADPRFPKN